MGRIAVFITIPAFLSILFAHSNAPEGQRPGPFFQSFLMRVTEDGKEINDWFEIWEVSGDFSTDKTSCSIQAAAFTLSEETRVNIWSHRARAVVEFLPRRFRIDMNGRLNPASELQVVIEFGAGHSRIVNISGTMRSGTKGQSVLAFHVDRKSENRRVPPLRNPSWNLEEK